MSVRPPFLTSMRHVSSMRHVRSMRHVVRRDRARRALAVAAVGVHAAGAASLPAGAAEEVHHVPPVSAPVVDAFRPPETPYGPGNRGLKFGTQPGDGVHASADGSVTFAGQVGGSLHVTVLHADGVRTSYSFLAAIEAVRGQVVHQGERVGTAGGVVHFGARLDGAYIDPASLFGGPAGEVELVPFEAPIEGADAGEAEALRQIALADGGDLGEPDLGEPADRRRGAAADLAARVAERLTLPVVGFVRSSRVL